MEEHAPDRGQRQRGFSLKGVFSPNPPFLLRYQGELLGLWDPQNRDLRRKLPPETNF